MLKLIPLLIICQLFSPFCFLALTCKHEFAQTTGICLNQKSQDIETGRQNTASFSGIKATVIIGADQKLITHLKEQDFSREISAFE